MGIRLGSLEVAVIVSVCVVSLDGPGVMPPSATFCGPELTFTTTLLNGFKVGASLTGTTVTMKEFVTESMPPLARPPLSFTTTVIVAVPNWFVSGANVSAPVELGLL